jgi:diphosphomevalonate decarboxylase
MLAQTILKNILGDEVYRPKKSLGQAYAPSNIALIKYWGKRDSALHLPMNSSLSISLGDKGATTTIQITDGDQHRIFLNHDLVSEDSDFFKNVKKYLDLFLVQLPYVFEIHTISTVPIAAGVASSACGFAALLLALDDLFIFGLPKEQLSILARLGSGSACRSLWQGFVVWHKGFLENGMDSFAEPLSIHWPDFMIGLWCFSSEKKSISSREGMQHTLETSSLYGIWPSLAQTACQQMGEFIRAKDFKNVGQLAESNALMMHATMHNANPPVNYWSQASIQGMKKVWQARQNGFEIYFTMDAGPNLKLLAQKKDVETFKKIFPEVEWVAQIEE